MLGHWKKPELAPVPSQGGTGLGCHEGKGHKGALITCKCFVVTGSSLTETSKGIRHCFLEPICLARLGLSGLTRTALPQALL